MAAALLGDTIDIRWIATDSVEPTEWPSLASLLDAAERERASRFHFVRDTHSYIAGHALMRAMLSEWLPVAPADWTFTVNAYGKPEAVMPPGEPRLRVNLSHTRGLAAVALTVGHDVGVDAEWSGRDGLTMGLAERFFSPAEVAALRLLPAEQQAEGLFAVWTLKEAFIKAVGMGLSMPLDAFSISLDPLAVQVAPERSEGRGDWFIHRFQPTAEHHLGLMVRHPGPSALRVTARAVSAGALLQVRG